MNIAGKNIFRKIFDGEMFIRISIITLLQIFCKINLNSEIVVISIRDPDDNFWRDPYLSINGLRSTVAK